MTTTLIVLAHPERISFNGAWAEATERASLALGHEVIWSDLCAMGFDAVEGKRHFPATQNSASFDPLKEQERASARDQLPADVAGEIDKVRRADRLVFHFPLWWFSPPAILKGWLDRVLVHGALHSVDERFDQGQCRGKKALFCVTLGATDAESGHNGKEGDARMLLWPLAYTMRYLGMTVLEPVFARGVHGYFEGEEKAALQRKLGKVLDEQAKLIAGFDDQPVIRFNPDGDFDGDGRLNPSAASHSYFIRHED